MDCVGYTRTLILSVQIVLVTLFTLCLDPSEEIIISGSAISLGEEDTKKGKYITSFDRFSGTFKENEKFHIQEIFDKIKFGPGVGGLNKLNFFFFFY